MFSKRVQRSTTPSSIPYPTTTSELAPSLSSPALLASPPTTPPRGHKRSFSKPMTWLNRSSSSTSSRSVPQPAQAHRPAPKSTRISEPKVGTTRSLQQFHSRGSGPLGSGATVVRTPQEALSSSTRAFDMPNDPERRAKSDILLRNTEKNETRHPQAQPSPPLPPLPDLADADGTSRLSGSSTNVSLSDHVAYPCSSGSLSHTRNLSSTHCRAPSRSAPNLLADAVPPVSQQPPFDANLLSPIPDGAIDPSKLIIILETSTNTYRTSLRSLTSRPSHLSRYITTLLSPAVSDAASMYSNASDTSSAQHTNWFNSLFRDHLASAGCLPQSSAIHIFLDRPSAPYLHVLAYLRSIPSTPEHPEALPRAVQLGPRPSPSRLESLLELRDEARYLGLVELERLCNHDIRRLHHRSALPAAATADAFGGKSTGSVRSFRTVVERCQSHQDVLLLETQALLKSDRDGGVRVANDSDATRIPSPEHKDVPVRGKRTRSMKHESQSPPVGWI